MAVRAWKIWLWMSGGGFAGWHLVFGALAGLTVAVIVMDDGLRFAEGRVALGLVAALGVWYIAFGAKAIRPSRRPGPLSGARDSADCGVVRGHAAGSIMLFALYPHMSALLPRRGARGHSCRYFRYQCCHLLPRHCLAVALGCADLLIGLSIRPYRSRTSSTRAGTAPRWFVTERQRLAREIHDTLRRGSPRPAAAGGDRGGNRPGPADLPRPSGRRGEPAEARALVDALAPPTCTPRRCRTPLAESRSTRRHVRVERQAARIAATQVVMLLRAAQEALTNAAKHASRVPRMTLSYAKP